MHINSERLEHVLSLGLVCAAAAFVLNHFGFPWTHTFFGLLFPLVLIYLRTARAKVSTEAKAVLVIGCDTGVGHTLALHLDQLGFRVFACCAHAEELGAGAQALRRKGSQRLHVLQLDFNNDLQIFEVFVRVTRLLAREEKLWALVNCEGLCWTHDALQSLDFSLCKRMCDVILFRTATTVRMFLPLVMHAKGRIVTFCSIRHEFSSRREVHVYLISKHAFDEFDKCLRTQLKYRGVHVCRIELLSSNTTESRVNHWAPAGIRANTHPRCMFDQVVRNRGEDYSEVVKALTEALTDVIPLTKYTSSIPC
nr:D-beta-hydroxybutyrate dehydrogenase, mitochondrial-like [Penaeus vannamei]